LLESVYEFALVKELQLRKIFVQYQFLMPLFYKGIDTNKEFVIDMLVEDGIVIEVKSVDVIHPVHQSQLLTCLKLSDKRMGFLINLNVTLLKDGFKRMVNNY
jgi:GxxExxY protein